MRKVRKGEAAYCCLGVANHMSGLGEWCDGEGLFRDASHKARHAAEVKEFQERGQYEDDYAEPPSEPYEEEFASPDVQRWLGLKENDGAFMLDGKITSLAQLNDGGRSFAEIADAIEAHADQLFVSDALAEYGPER